MFFDVLLMVLAAIAIVIAILGVAITPFMIGKPREPFSARGYLSVLFQSATMVLLSGRVFGWW
jgi:hypothetical protein